MEFGKDSALCESETNDEAVFIFICGHLSIQSIAGKAFTDVTSTRAIGEMGVIIGQPRQSQVIVLETSNCTGTARLGVAEIDRRRPGNGFYRLLLSLVKVLYTHTSRANADFAELLQRFRRLR